MTFNNSSAKWRHIRLVHEGIKYSCQKCGKEYADKKRLKMHVAKHHGGSYLLSKSVKHWPKSLTQEHLGGQSSYIDKTDFKLENIERESNMEPPAQSTSEDISKL